MLASSPKSVVRRYLQEVWGRGNLRVIGETCASTISVYVPGQSRGYHGTEELGRIVTAMRATFPDLTIRLDEEFAEGDRVVVRWTQSGTQRGEWSRGIPPTGKPLTWTGISLYRLAGGKILEERTEEDLRGVELQIGTLVRREPVPR